jgi:hypothetical protein
MYGFAIDFSFPNCKKVGFHPVFYSMKLVPTYIFKSLISKDLLQDESSLSM